jgi:hypothetical protein
MNKSLLEIGSIWTVKEPTRWATPPYNILILTKDRGIGKYKDLDTNLIDGYEEQAVIANFECVSCSKLGRLLYE